MAEGEVKSRWLPPMARAVVMGGIYLGCLWGAPHLRLPWPGLALVLSLLLFIGLALGLTGALVQVPMKGPALLLGLVLCAGLWALARMEEPRSPLANLMLILTAVFFGRSVAGLVREPNLLLPVLATAAVVDLWGVYYGPVSKVAQRAPEVIQQMAAQAPVFRPSPAGGTPLVPLVGVGDFIFLAILLSCVYRFGMNVRGTLGWAAALTFVGLMGVSFLPIRLPGLVFMGLAGVLANWKHFRFSREEKFALLYAGGLLAGVLGLLWWFWRG